MKKLIFTIFFIIFIAGNSFSQSIVIGDEAEMNIGTGSDICSGIYGNITGNLTGTGTNCNQAMPVELISFTSSVDKDNVVLNWKTATEENNRGFEIHRSIKNGKLEWYYIGFVKGAGTKYSPTIYNYTDNKLPVGNYYYRLKQIDNNGNMQYYDLNNFVEIKPPSKFELYQNYPNPFNPVTKINFTLSKDTKVSLKIYDINGREISTLINNKFLSADYYSIVFNSSNLASGVYFYRIITNEYKDIKKMVVLK